MCYCLKRVTATAIQHCPLEVVYMYAEKIYESTLTPACTKHFCVCQTWRPNSLPPTVPETLAESKQMMLALNAISVHCAPPFFKKPMQATAPQPPDLTNLLMKIHSPLHHPLAPSSITGAALHSFQQLGSSSVSGCVHTSECPHRSHLTSLFCSF